MWRVLLVFAVGCSDNIHSAPQVLLDAPRDSPSGLDGDENFCDASTTSGHAALTRNGVTTDFSFTFVAGEVSGGDLLPGNTPMGVTLLFTNSARLSPTTLQTCEASAQCPTDGVIARMYVPTDAALGSHDAQLASFTDSAFTLNGTAEVTDFTNPVYEVNPGRVAGMITTTGSGDTLSATFDAQFCYQLLTATI